ncbi:MAG: prolyl oligopeptidase family serine peptidase, partial [Fuerstiella sp.]|nr:prolyl oligopeptidase family serine peptidase [Fuerstiella sp.]
RVARWCFLIFVCCTAADCRGQSPRLYRHRVDPHWFAADTKFWYRVELPDRGAEFVLVDTEAGTRTPAFDHARVAREFAKAGEDGFDSHRLPISSLSFSDDMKFLTLTTSRGLWTLNLTSYELQQLEPGTRSSSQGRLFMPPRKSVDRGGDVELHVTNGLDSVIQLIWMGRDGQPVSYGTIDSGAKKIQHTFAGHVWLLKSADDTSLAAFEAVDGPNEIVVNAAGLQAMTERQNSQSSRRNRRPRDRDTNPPSPNGEHLAFVKYHDLWRMSAGDSTAEPQQLSLDGTVENTFQKDVSRRRLVEMQYKLQDAPSDVADVRWSPDSKHLIAFQTEKAIERRVYYVESSPKNQLQPRLESYPYAKPGDPIPTPRPRLFRVDDGQEVPVSNDLFSNPFKLSFLKWSDDSSRFWMLYNERGHQALRLLEITMGNGDVRAVVDERSETFIHYSTGGKFVLDWLPQDQLLWASERSGWNHLYRYDVSTGKVINPVTSGDWNVRRIERIDRDTGIVWFYAVGVVDGQDPYHEHFCRVNLDGSGLKVLTDGDGTHEVTFSPDRCFFVDRFSRVDLPPVTQLRSSTDGTLVTELETADASEVMAANGGLPQRFVAKGRDGETDIWGIIHRPRNFDAAASYAVVENIYAGPHDHHVPKAFRTRYRHQQQMTDRGMVVVQVDGMGTAWRSKAFHDVCYRNLRDAGFPDRIAWLKAAAVKYPWLDISRVGIYGGSAGGQNAMAAVLWHGTFYKAAVADCGCHDNRMDKLWWNEQWMGWPMGDHYAANSNAENAFRLQGALMLVVGELDRNVDPASTTQVVRKLIEANKDFVFLPIPGAGHGACETPYGSRRRADFLARHLHAVVSAEAASGDADLKQ